MATALTRSTRVLPSADHETTFHTPSLRSAEKSFRPTNGLLALSGEPAGVIAVTALNAVLSRISGATRIDFGHYLRDLSDDLAGTCGRSGGPKLRCTAASEALPIGAAIKLGLVADLLITNAFLYAFTRHRAGRISVSFTVAQRAWQLTVEDSGIALQAHGDPRDNGLIIARLLVLQLGGQLDFPEVTGGTRCIVAIPRPAAELKETRRKEALPAASG